MVGEKELCKEEKEPPIERPPSTLPQRSLETCYETEESEEMDTEEDHVTFVKPARPKRPSDLNLPTKEEEEPGQEKASSTPNEEMLEFTYPGTTGQLKRARGKDLAVETPPSGFPSAECVYPEPLKIEGLPATIHTGPLKVYLPQSLFAGITCRHEEKGDENKENEPPEEDFLRRMDDLMGEFSHSMRRMKELSKIWTTNMEKLHVEIKQLRNLTAGQPTASLTREKAGPTLRNQRKAVVDLTGEETNQRKSGLPTRKQETRV